MNNPLVPTPDVTEMRLPLALICKSNELDEDSLINYVVLHDPDMVMTDLDVPSISVTLPVPQEMAELFQVGKEYQVEVKVTIPDRAFTPFVRVGAV